MFRLEGCYRQGESISPKLVRVCVLEGCYRQGDCGKPHPLPDDRGHISSLLNVDQPLEKNVQF